MYIKILEKNHLDFIKSDLFAFSFFENFQWDINIFGALLFFRKNI